MVKKNITGSAEFISKSTRGGKINIDHREYYSLKYKEEIRATFHSMYFPSLAIFPTVGDSVSVTSLNSAINKLRSASATGLKHVLDQEPISGIGPGEVLIYLLADGAVLKGGTSKGLDVDIRGVAYEVKAVRVTLNRFAQSYRVGTHVPMGSVISKINQLREDMNIPGTKQEVKKTSLDLMASAYPERYAAIRAEFAKDAHKAYFDKHQVIFINNNASHAAGTIESIKNVKAQDISIERVSQGTIRPMVKL
jgi:hypothetical protein